MPCLPWLRRQRAIVSPSSRLSAMVSKTQSFTQCAATWRSLVCLGQESDAAAWKVLLVSGHAVATKSGAEMVPGLEGEFVNLRESTALMTKARGSSLIEYAVAFCAGHDVY